MFFWEIFFNKIVSIKLHLTCQDNLMVAFYFPLRFLLPSSFLFHPRQHVLLQEPGNLLLEPWNKHIDEISINFFVIQDLNIQKLRFSEVSKNDRLLKANLLSIQYCTFKPVNPWFCLLFLDRIPMLTYSMFFFIKEKNPCD